MSPIYLSALLTIAFFVLLVVEFMLPTGGMAGLAAAASIGAALVVLYGENPSYAAGLAVAITLVTPPMVASLIRIWPRTPLGRRILNRRRDDPETAKNIPKTRDGRPLDRLVGQTGVALTDLLPGGTIMLPADEGDRDGIGRTKTAAVSESGSINRGERVRVVSIRNRRAHVIKVEPHVDDHVENDDRITTAPANGEPSQPRQPASPEFDLDTLDD